MKNDSNNNNQFLTFPDPDLNLIPYYDEVISVSSGIIETNTETAPPKSNPTDYIDTGDFFRDATSAIRHYDNNMTEYPNACILALKEITNLQHLIWGHDYVIETADYRLTKRIQKSPLTAHITAYSTNSETYPDGQLVHEPIEIPVESIRKISLVLGYVVKQCVAAIICLS